MKNGDAASQMLAAAAIVRAQIAARRTGDHLASVETLLLEVTTHDDPQGVMSALSVFAASGIAGLAIATGKTPDELLDEMEEMFRGELS